MIGKILEVYFVHEKSFSHFKDRTHDNFTFRKMTWHNFKVISRKIFRADLNSLSFCTVPREQVAVELLFENNHVPSLN